jgi:hypothetical protein
VGFKCPPMMVDNEFELVETLTLENNSSYQGSGSGGTSGIIFIMKKSKEFLSTQKISE